MNNKGFIATTLIYSFLLLFATLVVVIIGNYSYYRTTLNKYNKSINDALNGKIDTKYVTLYNEVANSDFEIRNNSWGLTGGAAYNTDTKKDGTLSLRFSSQNTSLSSNTFNCTSGRYYYVTYYVFTNGNINNGSIGLFTSGNSRIVGEDINYVIVNYGGDYNFNWKRRGFLGMSNYSGTCKFYVSYNNNIGNTVMNIDDIVVTDVTDILQKANIYDTARLANIFNNNDLVARIDYFSNYLVYNTDDLINSLS